MVQVQCNVSMYVGCGMWDVGTIYTTMYASTSSSMMCIMHDA